MSEDHSEKEIREIVRQNLAKARNNLAKYYNLSRRQPKIGDFVMKKEYVLSSAKNYAKMAKGEEES